MTPKIEAIDGRRACGETAAFRARRVNTCRAGVQNTFEEERVKRHPVITVLISAALLLAGCQAARPAALSNEQVAQVADNILKAIDAGNYQDFTRDFSDHMKSVFSEAQFDQIRYTLQSTSGGFVSRSAMKLSNNSGYATYQITCKYEREEVTVTVVFKIGGVRVEGLFFDSPNLRRITR